MGYLGRAEAWVEACRFSEAPATPEEGKCRPGIKTIDTATGEIRGEAVTLYAPRPAAEYSELRKGFLPDKKAEKKLGKTLPVSLLDALSVETSELRKQGWNQPPAARKVAYLRPVDALRPQPIVGQATPPSATTVGHLRIGKPLPPL